MSDNDLDNVSQNFSLSYVSILNFMSNTLCPWNGFVSHSYSEAMLDWHQPTIRLIVLKKIKQCNSTKMNRL